MVMAIKEDLKAEVKEEGGGKDELDALDALEKEAKEYDKVRSYPVLVSSYIFNKTLNQDAEIDRIIQAFKLDASVTPIPLLHLSTNTL